MPITQSAKKALKGSLAKRSFNLARKTALSKTIKSFKKLVLDKKIKEAEAMMPQVQKVIDKSSKVGIIKKNTASRKKSKLTLMLKSVK